MERREYSVLHCRVDWPRPRRYVFQTLQAAHDFVDELRADEAAAPLEFVAVHARRVGPWAPLGAEPALAASAARRRPWQR